MRLALVNHAILNVSHDMVQSAQVAHGLELRYQGYTEAARLARYIAKFEAVDLVVGGLISYTCMERIGGVTCAREVGGRHGVFGRGEVRLLDGRGIGCKSSSVYIGSLRKEQINPNASS